MKSAMHRHPSSYLLEQCMQLQRRVLAPATAGKDALGFGHRICNSGHKKGKWRP